MMKNKIRFTLVLVVALCMLVSSVVFATEVNDNTEINTPNMATVIDPETGEILQATPRVGGENGIAPISADLDPEDLMPISDDLLENGAVDNDYDREAEEDEEEDDSNTVIFVIAGVGILILVIIVAIMMKKE